MGQAKSDIRVQPAIVVFSASVFAASYRYIYIKLNPRLRNQLSIDMTSQSGQ
jgi:hypothetical protein